MRKYIVNSTYCIYMLQPSQLYFDESILTTDSVIQEVKYEKNISIEIHTVPVKKINITGKTDKLSDTDLELLCTAKAMSCVLVSDDKNLIKAAQGNNVYTLDTPHFIHKLLMDNKWTEEKGIEVLNKLRNFYNRVYVIDKVLKNIKN